MKWSFKGSPDGGYAAIAERFFILRTILRRKKDGRLARLAILCFAGTFEDPDTGAHEAFLGQVLPVASDFELFGPGETEGAMAFLATWDPLHPPTPPRMVNDPSTATMRKVGADEEAPIGSFLAL